MGCLPAGWVRIPICLAIGMIGFTILLTSCNLHISGGCPLSVTTTGTIIEYRIVWGECCSWTSCSGTSMSCCTNYGCCSAVVRLNTTDGICSYRTPTDDNCDQNLGERVTVIMNGRTGECDLSADGNIIKWLVGIGLIVIWTLLMIDCCSWTLNIILRRRAEINNKMRTWPEALPEGSDNYPARE